MESLHHTAADILYIVISGFFSNKEGSSVSRTAQAVLHKKYS
jgi:hypothetical protein